MKAESANESRRVMKHGIVWMLPLSTDDESAEEARSKLSDYLNSILVVELKQVIGYIF